MSKQQRPSESFILVWVGVSALPSATVVTTGTLITHKWNLYGASSIIHLSQATVRTFAVTTISHSHYSEDNTTDDGKTTNNRANDNRRQVAFDLTDMLGGQ